jgi:probable HAF family extracellular repeat protein
MMKLLPKVIVLAVSVLLTPLYLQSQASLVELGSLGGSEGEARGVNDAGQVVGWSRTASAELRAFLWQDGVMSDLGIPDSVARAINEHGDIAGYYQVSGNDHAFLRRGGLLFDLGIGRGYALNERGDVVGESVLGAALWTNSTRIDLGLLAGASTCWAFGINNRQQVVGGCIVGSTRRAFLWDSGQMQDLGTLGGSYAEAKSINERGQIVGGSTATTIPGQAFLRAFLWERGVMSDLGTLGGSYSAALANTSGGAVVGEATTQSGITHAFFEDGKGMTDLGPLGEYSAAFATNHSGVVVGSVGVGAGLRPVLWQR